MMDRDPRISPETTAQQRTASDPTIWADYFNLGSVVESNTGNCSGSGLYFAQGLSYHWISRNGRADFAGTA
jgi:hypothetical protein